MSTPEETWEQRAEAFRRGMTEVDQAGDMLAELRAQISDLLAERGVAQLVIAELTRERDEARAKRWKAAAKFWRRERERVRQTLEELVDVVEQAECERDEARAALLRRMSKDDTGGA